VRELQDEDESAPFGLLKLLSVPGGPTPLMKVLQHIFGVGRRGRAESSSGGAEIPVAGMVPVTKVGSHAKVVPAPSGLKVESQAVRVDGVYPEWNWEMSRYRQAWCWVTEYDPPPTSSARVVGVVRDPDLCRRLVRLGLSLERHRRQVDGETLDLDPLIETMIGRAAGESGEERVYQTRRKTAHDLGVLLLLDASGSTGQRHRGEHRTYDEQLRVAANLATALEAIGDRVAVFAFNSQGRHAVQLQRVKDFGDRFDHAALGRLASLEPSGYTRLGAAIRHGLHLVTERSGATNRLLVVISDGFPFDEGYEGIYAERDTRQALSEARHKGIGVVCLSVATSTKEQVLERVFGTSAHLDLAHAADLNEYVESAFRSALQVASKAHRTVTGHSKRVLHPANGRLV
jgi:nitric oxide reductase activation protein